jgi:hypothetical protein
MIENYCPDTVDWNEAITFKTFPANQAEYSNDVLPISRGNQRRHAEVKPQSNLQDDLQSKINTCHVIAGNSTTSHLLKQGS